MFQKIKEKINNKVLLGTVVLSTLPVVSAFASTGDASESAVDFVKPLVTDLKGQILGVAKYVIPIGFGIYVVFWGVKFAKRQITKSAHS